VNLAARASRRSGADYEGDDRKSATATPPTARTKMPQDKLGVITMDLCCGAAREVPASAKLVVVGLTKVPQFDVLYNSIRASLEHP
jgi:hypothetical protein